MATNRVKIDVSISSGGQMADDVLQDNVRRELECLRQDLSLPVELQVRFDASPSLRSGEHTIAFDGRYFATVREVRDKTSERQAHAIATTIHANRGAMLTSAVVESLWSLWGGEQPAPDNFAGLLRNLARYRLRADRAAAFVPRWSETDPAAALEEALSDVTRRIAIELHPNTYALIHDELAADDLFPMMIDGFFYELGVRVGQCIATPTPDIARDRVRLRINDVRAPLEPIIGADELLVNDVADRLALINIKGRRAYNPANDNECAIVSRADKAACEAAGLTTWTCAGYVVLVIAAALRRSAAALVSEDTVASELAGLRTAFPRLVDALAGVMDVRQFTRVLRALVADEISIRGLPLIIDTILRVPPPCTVSEKYIVFTSTWTGVRPRVALVDAADSADAIEVSEYIRTSLKRYISHKYTRGNSTLIVYLVEPQIEERISNRRFLVEAEAREIIDAVSTEVGGLPPTSQVPVILTTSSVRYGLRQLLRTEFPKLPVLSYQELSPEMNIQPISRIVLG